MDTSMRLTAATDSAAVQAARQQRPAADAGAAPAAVSQTPPAVQVTISAEARAAAATATETASPVSPTGAAERPAPSAASTSAPADDAVRLQPGRDAGAEAAAQGVATARAAEQPDAASSKGSPAVQLYLDNATRPAGQPTPTVLRTSA